MSELEPADTSRCQAESRAPHSFMSFGPKPPMKRCESKPEFIAVEIVPKDKDGETGQMSLCASCADAMSDQLDMNRIRLVPIVEKLNVWAGRTEGTFWRGGDERWSSERAQLEGCAQVQSW